MNFDLKKLKYWWLFNLTMCFPSKTLLRKAALQRPPCCDQENQSLAMAVTLVKLVSLSTKNSIQFSHWKHSGVGFYLNGSFSS